LKNKKINNLEFYEGYLWCGFDTKSKKLKVSFRKFINSEIKFVYREARFVRMINDIIYTTPYHAFANKDDSYVLYDLLLEKYSKEETESIISHIQDRIK
jgi:hypothetical protein